MPVDLRSEAAKAPRGSEVNPERLADCDLVMKGGITSGLVYPGAAIAIAQRYRFRSLGGSSAGAIAAGLIAAAEHGRRRDDGSGEEQERRGMFALASAADDLRGKGFLAGLFQPDPAAPPALLHAFALLRDGELPAKREGEGGWAWARRSGLLGAPELQRLRGFALIAAIIALTFVAALAFVLVTDEGWVAIPALVALLLLGITALLARRHVKATAGTFAAYGEALGDRGFGICTGKAAKGAPPALIEWLHASIQRCAGRGLGSEEVLTFGDLGSTASPGTSPDAIRLQMTTTDLALGHPLVVPEDLGEYLFDPDELHELFPTAVVNRMCRGVKPVGLNEAGKSLYPFVLAQLPVIVGLRLSLSFPLLLSAVRLWRWERAAVDGPMAFVPHTLSDGGIASNFPIHFFDSWLPSRPTFGLDLASVPTGAPTDPFLLPAADAGPQEDPPSKWGPTDSVGEFASQIKDAAQNWRDLMQLELRGYRERVCRIPLAPGEGGLNLGMDETLIDGLIGRGLGAGALLRDAFGRDEDGSRWPAHRFGRYLTLMSSQLGGWERLDTGGLDARGEASYPPNREYLERLAHTDVLDKPLTPPDAERLQAIAAAWRTFELARRSGADPSPDFASFKTRPPAALRIVPRG